MEPHILAVDIGGTNTIIGVVNQQGNVKNRLSILTNGQEGRTSLLDRLIRAIQKTIYLSTDLHIVGIGVGIAGPTDLSTGVMHNPPHLPGWNNFSLKESLENHFSLSVFVGNDATLSALAEYKFGAGAGNSYKDLVYITVSTGIGGGLVINGIPHFGSRGYSGEIGHMAIVPRGPRCDCGGNGCLESVASGTAIARDARDILSSGVKDSIMRQDVGGYLNRITSLVVANAARQKDQVAVEIIEKAARYLGIGLANIIVALDPDIIVIGGGVSNSLDLMMPSLTRELDKRSTKWLGSRTQVIKSYLGDDAAVIGAACFASSSLYSK